MKKMMEEGEGEKKRRRIREDTWERWACGCPYEEEEIGKPWVTSTLGGELGPQPLLGRPSK